jgi:CRP/FNR family transcriptional regulator, nitrogen fixation regulation protein
MVRANGAGPVSAVPRSVQEVPRMETITRAPLRERQQGSILAGSLGLLEPLATVVRFEVGETIYLCKEPAEFWYLILTGVARKYALAFDGRRQIVDFLLPGDLFGFGAHATHQFSAEAIVPGTTVAACPRRDVERLADAAPQVARRLRELAFESISRVQTRVVILGRTSALEKVSAFLLEMADRSCAGPTTPVMLPMSRYDIADYLAMAVETVSRALTDLRGRGVIQFGSVRSVQIRNRAALERISEGPAGVDHARAHRLRFPVSAAFDAAQAAGSQLRA